MSRSDRVRRAVSLTLAVLCFLVVPQLAFGQFSSRKAPTLSVGAATVVTPSAVTGTYSCKVGWVGFGEGADVRVTGFTVNGQPNGVSYDYRLYRGASQRDIATETVKEASLSTGLDWSDGGNTVYRLTIVTKVGLWTSTEYSKSFTCGTRLPGSGSL